MQSEDPVTAPVVAQPVQAIHGSIVKAVCKIMTTVTAVKKSQRNQHGGYNFASTDDIYAAVTHKMGECGLILITREDSCEVVRVEKEGKTSQWARITFSFVLATEEGTWADPFARRTLFLQVTGAQTFQAAQSYAEKAYLRSLFKLPTGDMDLDGMPQADTEEAQIALSGGVKRKSSHAAKKDGTTAVFDDIRKSIASAMSADFLEQVQTLYAEEWGQMPKRWVEILDNEYEDKMLSFGTREAAA
jgi:hypothetical protein